MFPIVLVVVIYAGVGAADGINDLSVPMQVTIHPSSQNVAENSRVLFTCVSTYSDVTFEWTKPVRDVDEKKDGVLIMGVGNNMSVFAIEQAHLKKHKRTFRCTAYFKGNGGTIIARNAEARLRVIPFDRLHKNFPHILPISSADDIVLPSPIPGTADMMCRTTLGRESRYRPDWYWIKDGRIDLRFTSDYKSDRIEINKDGRLHISGLREADTGSYMCVAENQRGTAYGTPFQMNVTKTESRQAVNGTCMREDGMIVMYGDEYNPAGDPCQTCICIENGRFSCRTVRCAAPLCGGRKYVMSRDKCCDYTCLEAGEVMQGHEGHAHCLAHNGSLVHEGQHYQRGSDPCEKCICGEEDKPECFSIMCDAPPCQDYETIPGTCCEFRCPVEASMCTDRDGMKVSHDFTYMPEEDPCVRCTCEHGRKGQCMMVACDAPRCTNYVSSRDVCCNYTCTDDIIGSCTAHDGELVKDGDDYQLSSDPCTHCTCSMGRSVFCRSMSCIPEPMPCSNPKPVPGICCRFTCGETATLRDKILSHVFVQQIGSSDAFVQWQLPASASYRVTIEDMTNITVYVFNNITSMVPTRVVRTSGKGFAILKDLDSNSVYYVMVNGTSRDRTAVMMTRPVRLELDGRVGSSFQLNDALSQVFESRGDIAYDGYSLPRPFLAVGREERIRFAINFHTFHRVDITTYNETPCPNQDCGMLRFYMYSQEGQPRNVMSLMFADVKDFLWAKAHL